MASAATIEKRKQRHATALARGTEAFVPTPEEIAWHITGYPYSNIDVLPPGAEILEPSSGDNALVQQILERNRDVHVTAIEPNAARAAQGRPQVKDEWGYPAEYKVDYVASTLEDYVAANPGRRFDGVVMNPPWSLVGQPTTWVTQTMIAWGMLRPGGRLVAIVPSGFRHRSGKKFTEFRELVAAHGGVERLPAVRVKGWPYADVIWMVKPLDLGGRDAWLVPTYTGLEKPVRVANLRRGGEAVTAAPVQVWGDPWSGHRDRVLRFMGQCVTPTCRHLTWGFDDGQNDPRGILGDAAASPLEAAGSGKVGPSVALCFYCANTAAAYTAALARTRDVWTARPPKPAPPTAVWNYARGVEAAERAVRRELAEAGIGLGPADDGGLFPLDAIHAD